MFLDKKSTESSDESITADDVYFASQKPAVRYAYDAYQEKLKAEVEAMKRGLGGSRQASLAV